MLIRIVDFVRGIDEHTKDGHVSVLDAAQATLDEKDWIGLTRRDSAIELQQMVEREMLERTNIEADRYRYGGPNYDHNSTPDGV